MFNTVSVTAGLGCFVVCGLLVDSLYAAFGMEPPDGMFLRSNPYFDTPVVVLGIGVIGVMFVVFALVGFAWAAINVNSLPMVVEMCRGSDIGKFTGYYYTASQAAQIITPILSGFVLEYGYLLVDQANPDAGYVLLFPYGTLFVALSFVTMLFVRHGDAKVEGKKDLLESLDIED